LNPERKKNLRIDDSEGISCQTVNILTDMLTVAEPVNPWEVWFS